MQIINELKTYFEKVVSTVDSLNSVRVLQYLSEIPLLCQINKKSSENRKLRNSDKRHFHPVKVTRGQIYNANITEGAGSELCGNHLVIIVQGKTSNLFGEKVTILPIEGDGRKIDPKYQIKLTNTDLESGKLDKDPSRIIFTDIYTIDKARLERCIGKLTPTKLVEINKSIKKHLEM